MRARLLTDGSSHGQRDALGGETSIEVRLEPSERRAALVLREPNGDIVERSVEGESCAELASALAVIAALAFGAESQAPGAAPANVPMTGDRRAAAPTIERAEPTTRGPGHIEPSEHSDAPNRGEMHTRDASVSVPHAELGAGASLNTWSAPDGSLGGDAFVRLSSAVSGGWSLRLGAVYGFGASYVGERRAEFLYWGGRAEGCPILQKLSRNVLGEGCLAVDAGALRGRGDTASALLNGRSQTLFSAAAVLLARARARFGERLFVEGQGELGLPFVRHEFVFENPSERIFRTPTVGLAARVGLAVQFL